MGKSVCIAIGASNYTDARISHLPGATPDAELFFGVATSSEYGSCDVAGSELLLDPAKEQVRETVTRAITTPEVGCLTIFFAGHGIETNSGYFLTCKDCDIDRVALTGLSLTDVFQLLNEGAGVHTNIVLDACEAGGVAIDLSAITKSFEAGVAGGSSVSILAMSSRREAAEEAPDGSGGFGTKALLALMKGDADTGSNASELTLADIAQSIQVEESLQTPSFWSFNLQGGSAFCKNAFALKHRKDAVYLAPSDIVGVKVDFSTSDKEKLWRCYLDFTRSQDMRQVHSVVSDLIADMDSHTSAPSVLLGFFDSFLYRARNAEDAFASVLLAAVFAMLASDVVEDEVLTTHFVNALSDELDGSLARIADAMESESLFLVQGAGGYSEFFSLPQRITSLTAWAFFAVRIATLLGKESATVANQVERIISCLSKDYTAAFDLVSERQAPSIAVIAALSRDEYASWVKMLLGCLYNSYFFFQKKVARADLHADDVFKFLRHRVSSDSADYEKFCARPSEVLLTLLAGFWKFEEVDIVQFDFADLDGTFLGTFIPNDYCRFSSEVVPEGSNIYFRIGFEIFTVEELVSFFEGELKPRVVQASDGLSDIQDIVATCVALVFPDRIPWQIFGWDNP